MRLMNRDIRSKPAAIDEKQEIQQELKSPKQFCRLKADNIGRVWLEFLWQMTISGGRDGYGGGK
jgi:hypothetical protein